MSLADMIVAMVTREVDLCAHGMVIEDCLKCCRHGRILRDCIKCNPCPHNRTRRGCTKCSPRGKSQIKRQYDSACIKRRKTSGACPHESDKTRCLVCSAASLSSFVGGDIPF